MSPLEKITKAELHRHLELCLRPDTIWELAPQFGIALKSQQEFQDRFMILEPMKDLGTVLNKFMDTQKLLASPQILERIAFEACEDCYLKEGLRIVEFRYAPTFIEQGHDMTFEQMHEAIVKGIRRAEATYPMAVGLIAIIQRILPVKDAERVTAFAIEHKDSFVGLDLADNEEGFDSKPFAPLFHQAKAGLGITVHSGESSHPKAPKWVMDAVDVLGAERIGHGLQIIHDPEVMTKIRDQGVVLELCPTSNMLTNAVPDLKDHPLKKLYEFGIQTTINTDDPGIFNTNLNREYRICREVLGMSESDLEKCAQIAAERSFIPRAKRQAVWPRPLGR
ncbi:MAG TPA: adenosine deaminase [Bdellovibrionales bacterium]|nr:adenosine deaminase [Bdellovibrionales bacterium]